MQLYHGFRAHTITGLGYNKKLAKRFDSGTKASDYWEACGRKFDHLQEIGMAMKNRELEVPESGKIQVKKIGLRSNEVPGIKFTAYVLAGCAVVGLGISASAAFMAVTSPLLIVLPMVGGMISASMAVGFAKAAQAFVKTPQIKERGLVSLDTSKGKVALFYTFVHGSPRRVVNL